MLRADWCGVCRVVDPVFAEARRAFDADPRVRVITVDFSAPDAAYDAMLGEVVEAGATPIYNGYFMATGFAAIAPPGASAPAACLTRVHNAEAMAEVVRALAAQAEREGPATLALGQDLFCPAMKPPPPDAG